MTNLRNNFMLGSVVYFFFHFRAYTRFWVVGQFPIIRTNQDFETGIPERGDRAPNEKQREMNESRLPEFVRMKATSVPTESARSQ